MLLRGLAREEAIGLPRGLVMTGLVPWYRCMCPSRHWASRRTYVPPRHKHFMSSLQSCWSVLQWSRTDSLYGSYSSSLTTCTKIVLCKDFSFRKGFVCPWLFLAWTGIAIWIHFKNILHAFLSFSTLSGQGWVPSSPE